MCGSFLGDSGMGGSFLLVVVCLKPKGFLDFLSLGRRVLNLLDCWHGPSSSSREIVPPLLFVAFLLVARVVELLLFQLKDFKVQLLSSVSSP